MERTDIDLHDKARSDNGQRTACRAPLQATAGWTQGRFNVAYPRGVAANVPGYKRGLFGIWRDRSIGKRWSLVHLPTGRYLIKCHNLDAAKRVASRVEPYFSDDGLTADRRVKSIVLRWRHWNAIHEVYRHTTDGAPKYI